MTKPTLPHARDWLLNVRSALNIAESAEEATVICTRAARLLSQDYTAEDLCFDSREHVSATLRFWNERDIRDRLDVWRDRQRRSEIHRPPQWLVVLILAQCSGEPGPLLREWLEERDAMPAPVPVAFQEDVVLFGDL
jgi:hypothetical protein